MKDLLKPGEIAIKVEGTPWYVTNLGRIITTKGKGKIRKPSLNRNGYLMVNYKGKNYYVHHLAARAFLGETPDGMCINHVDGDKTNNEVTNLEFATLSRNIRHAQELGLKNPVTGESNGMSKLSNEESKELIRLIQNGLSNQEIAIKYNLHPNYVSLIRHKKRWKTVWQEVESATTIETVAVRASVQ